MSAIHAGSSSQLPVAVECNDGRLHFVNVARDATVARLEDAVRAALGSKKLSLIINGCTPAASTMLRDIHDSCKRTDGLLYVAVRAEKAMGGYVTPCCVWDGPYDREE
ncbi:ATG8/AUT7/APG8/PAZ2 putative (ATG8B1) [Leptomonas seymouri]|uniref:ATG8/AUT7/APG8/PAZ2 putative (ATG8B1) n=1 Tax=Leptomonas seymouri TaxID=5684 RepID=A0A0N1HR42_LEPSE|nr:ATG8/AUT7/APG8/PAZ2 putative (ATG8B1) [Leptomonas seymouri]|eukprot:KPI82610.1 ATG8/AUT7/APG8/PAZ2 putative (ATG8B1) [Leptomonas seymouri]